MVKKAEYTPERGDLIWLDFNPRTGHEQAGHRPALVLSPKAYNRATGLALMCPVTGRIKGYPFETVLPDGLEISGAVLCDHVKNLDWRARSARFADSAPVAVVADVRAKILTLL